MNHVNSDPGSSGRISTDRIFHGLRCWAVCLYNDVLRSGPSDGVFVAFEFDALLVIPNIWRRRNPHPCPSSAMALLRPAFQAMAASLSPAEPATTKPPSGSGQQGPAAAATSSRRRLISSAAVLASSASQMLAPAASRGAGAFDLRISVPEKSGEDAEAVVKAHARNLLRVKRLIDAGAWRELQAELRASASNLKQDLYAIIQDSPASRRPELRRLYSNLFNSVTNLDYAARDKDERQVQEHYGNIVSALDEIFAKIT